MWKSVVDPLGLVFAGAQLLFHPSLIVFAAALVPWAFSDDDATALDARAARRRPG